MEMHYIFIWWVWLLLIGLVSLPLGFKLFSGFLDKGWGLTKTATIIAASYSIFILSTLKIINFTRINIVLVILMTLAVNILIYLKDRQEVNNFIRKKFGLILFEEVFFAFGLFLWAFVRSHQPDINGLEKFMDFGFVNSILRSDFLPPLDMWASGQSINYYWYGHYITAFLIKLINVPSGIGYNLMLGTILGLSLTTSFSLVSSLIGKAFKAKSSKAAVVGGIISALLLNFAGNMHTPYYALKDGVEKYWYPDATRFIGYNPDVPDKTIHEFPIYSYVVSDLHAHLLNLPFVLLFLSLLYSLVLAKSSISKDSKFQNPNSKQYQSANSQIKNISHWPLIINHSQNKNLILLGFVLGVMFMTNAWDIANYLLVTGFVFLLATQKDLKATLTFQNMFKVSVNIIIIILAALITTLPFIMNFQSIAQGVDITHTKTPLWQLGILWGFPLILTAIFVLRMQFFKKAKREDFFVLALLTSSWMLIAIPEFIYVKDIYASTHYRANTMFKLTYQAYVMFYLSSGYIAITFIKRVKSVGSKIGMALLLAVIFTSVLYYPFVAVKSYYGDIFDKVNPTKSLTGDLWLKEKYSDTFEVVSWFRQNIEGQPTILEAPGDSYTDYGVISSYTGLPTVSGWYVHEWLWRGTPDFPQGRVNDITTIYNTGDSVLAKSLLNKYAVKYVVVGSFEKEKFPELNEEKFSKIGNVVYLNRTSKIYQIH